VQRATVVVAAAQRQALPAPDRSLEEESDALVYELYGSTGEEIAIAEEAHQ
jgi:hypothetical protein